MPLTSADGPTRVTQPLSLISADSSARVAWVQVQVEGSGKWPDNEEAAGKLRSALGCQIAQALESQFGMHARAAEGHVDVHAQGFVLRLQLWSDRDDALAERTAQVRTACMHAWADGTQRRPGHIATMPARYSCLPSRSSVGSPCNVFMAAALN